MHASIMAVIWINISLCCYFLNIHTSTSIFKKTDYRGCWQTFLSPHLRNAKCILGHANLITQAPPACLPFDQFWLFYNWNFFCGNILNSIFYLALTLAVHQDYCRSRLESIVSVPEEDSKVIDVAIQLSLHIMASTIISPVANYSSTVIY